MISDRELREFRRFHYCAYWGTWNRMIVPWSAELSKTVGYVELDLTPVNPDWNHSWDDMQHMLLRSHLTAFGKKDKLTDRLPDCVMDVLRKRYTHDQLLMMLGSPNSFWLDNIDFEALRRSPSGGTPFISVRRTDRPFEVLSREACS